jgi:RNA recognition motif-containing protein
MNGDKMETRLYIGNMPQEMTEQDLRTMFSEAGTVESVDVVMDRRIGKPRGFAFVTMNSLDEAEKAILMFNAKDINGRTLKVNITLPREEQAGADASSNKP